jgi:hypothetical protein
MAKTFKTIILMALPASGKSEVRKYLRHVPVDKRVKEFHMGDNIQLDDFPYVHFMRCIDLELKAIGKDYLFYHAPDNTFQNDKEWGTLIELINDDYDAVFNHHDWNVKSDAEFLFDRIDKARAKVGLPKVLSALDSKTRATIIPKLEKEAKGVLDAVRELQAESLDGKTTVIEFARGGADGSSMPLTGGMGYQYSLSLLSKAILDNAVILYIWVTPEESRRKNENRTDPNDPGSILHHGVPHVVMMHDYGCDDVEYLLKNSEKPGTITVKAHGKTYNVPFARFDNRVDKTSFIRNEAEDWKTEEVKAIHEGLKGALDHLAQFI